MLKFVIVQWIGKCGVLGVVGLACTRFRRHQVWRDNGTGGGSVRRQFICKRLRRDLPKDLAHLSLVCYSACK